MNELTAIPERNTEEYIAEALNFPDFIPVHKNLRAFAAIMIKLNAEYGYTRTLSPLAPNIFQHDDVRQRVQNAVTQLKAAYPVAVAELETAGTAIDKALETYAAAEAGIDQPERSPTMLVALLNLLVQGGTVSEQEAAAIEAAFVAKGNGILDRVKDAVDKFTSIVPDLATRLNVYETIEQKVVNGEITQPVHTATNGLTKDFMSNPFNMIGTIIGYMPRFDK